MKIVGIMGGSGCGKSYICSLLEQQGVVCVDADAVYHRLLQTNASMLGEIREEFGDSVFQNNVLDRRALAQVVFQDPEKLLRLNRITHPYVTREILRDSNMREKEGAGVYLIDAPLLHKTPLIQYCEEVIFVFCPFEKRVERIMRRDGLTRRQAEQRIFAQPADEEYRAYATLCIDGSQSRENLIERLRGVLH